MRRAYRAIARWIPTWRPGKLAQHGGVLLGWMLLRAGAQIATVILLARSLGAGPYGAFVAIVAIASFVVPLVGLGLSNIVLRNGARDPTHLPQYFARAARVWRFTLFPSALLAFALACWLLPPGLPIPAMLAAISAELAASALTELRARQHQAQHRINAFGAINAGLPLMRLLALGLLILFTGQTSLADALWAYVVASLAYLVLLMPGLRTPPATLRSAPTEAMPLRSGLPFCMSALAMRMQGEFNKPILMQAGYGLAGSYNIAQRAVEMASLPLLALQESLWSRLYAQSNPITQLRRTGLALLALALLLGCGLWLSAPLLRWVVGPGYDDAIAVLRLLAWLPMLQVGRSLLNFRVIHHGRMSLIGWASALGGVTSVLGVLALVPRFGMSGAVAASYAAEIVMVAFLLLAARRLAHGNPPDARHVDA